MKKNSKRVETKPSRTALMNCIARATSFYENRSQYKSSDHIAPLLLPRLIRAMLKMKMVRTILTKKLIPKGLYEYAIGRTKYIDSVFEDSIQDGFKQVVILGAGFDSRSIRFSSPDKAVKIFELDAPATQNDKLRRLKNRKIEVRDNIIFIPINLDNESAADALASRGFDKDKKTLFLMEGILMFLSVQAVDSIFSFLQSSSGRGSEIVFDFIYKSVLRKENRFYGEEEAYGYGIKAGERLAFGIEDKELGSVLAGYGFSMQEKMDSDKLNRMYFNDEKEKRPGVVNEILCMVRARKT